MLDRRNNEILDKEWVLLIQTARDMGISTEEVKLYISNHQILEQSQRKHSPNHLEELLSST